MAMSSKCLLRVLFNDLRHVFSNDDLGAEIIQIALPAALALMADPVASLIDTAFIGQIGPVELAAVGVAIAAFNQASRIAIFPVVSVTTSFVAEEDAVNSMSMKELEERGLEKASFGDETEKLVPYEDPEENLFSPLSPGTESAEMVQNDYRRKNIPSASTALIVGGVLGLVQATILIILAKPILHIMGVKSDSHMFQPACQYLTLRSFGAPAVLLSLAMQGIFRGFKDTKTPLYATVAGDALNIVLDPILIFSFNLGVTGAAIAHVLSQYLISLILLWRLMSQIDIFPSSARNLQFGKFLRSGFLLLTRVIAVTFCVTLSASMAARQGSVPMAAFQICLQIWLAVSLLADGLAVAGQAILASAFARKDYHKATSTAARVLQLSVVLGLALALVLGIGMPFASRLFTKDVDVLQLIHVGIPFVAATQPINTAAFVFDGINYGASDFSYSAYSMVLVAMISILCVVLLSFSYGFIGIWIALTIYMSLRMLAGLWRIGTGSGPWSFLRV